MVHRATIAGLILLTVALAGPGAAQATDRAVEAAIAAGEANDEHCASLHSGEVERQASSMLALAEVWQHVTEVHEATQQPFLLYWRGVLGQCLGREEAAESDLRAFVASQVGSSSLASTVRQAKERLRRLVGLRDVGKGAAAGYLRRGAAFELSVSWGAGGGLHELACTDPDRPPEGPRVENSACDGGTQAVSDSSGVFSPAGVELAVDGFPTRSLGLGARLIVDVAAPTGLPNPRSPGPTVQVLAGPQLRVLGSAASGGRAGALRIEPRVAVAFSQLSPMAGSAKYGPSTGYLDAGTLELRQFGGALRIEGAIELSPRAVLLLAGHVAGYPPLPGSAAGMVTEPSTVTLRLADDVTRDEAVRIQPELSSSALLTTGGRADLLFADPHDAIAAGPYVAVDLLHTSAQYPNAPDSTWCAADCAAGDENLRTVYSTRRDVFVLRGGVQLRFGAGGE